MEVKDGLKMEGPKEKKPDGTIKMLFVMVLIIFGILIRLTTLEQRYAWLAKDQRETRKALIFLQRTVPNGPIVFMREN